jgi:hypothetical protein
MQERRWDLWRHFANQAKKPEQDPKVEFEGFTYTPQPKRKLKIARDISIRYDSIGANFTAALITEVLHLRSQIKDLAEEHNAE